MTKFQLVIHLKGLYIIDMKTYRKNSRRNPWRNNMKRREIQWDNVFGKLLVISVPIMIICLSANITMRMSDTYQYSLSSSQVLDSAPVVVEETALVNLFGSYMQHRTAVFSLKEAVSYKPGDAFNAMDRQFMHNLRKTMDVILMLGIAMLAISALGYFFLIRWRKKVWHMMCFKKSFVVFLILSAVSAASTAIPFFRENTWERLFNTGFADGDLLALILQKGFALQVTVFNLIISFVLMGILAYATWEVAGRKKCSKGGRT